MSVFNKYLSVHGRKEEANKYYGKQDIRNVEGMSVFVNAVKLLIMIVLMNVVTGVIRWIKNHSTTEVSRGKDFNWYIAKASSGTLVVPSSLSHPIYHLFQLLRTYHLYISCSLNLS